MSLGQAQEDEGGLLGRGVAALRGGDRARARELLAAAVRADPRSASAWLWLSGALDDPAQQRECLEHALALDPANEAARRGLAALGSKESGVGSRESGADSRLPTPDSRLPTPDSRLPTPDSRLLTPDSRLPTPDSRLPTPDSRLLTPGVTFVLGGLGGAGAALTWAAWRGLGAEAGGAGLLVIALLGGAPLGLAALVIGGVLLRTAGRGLGGAGGAGAVRSGLAWAAAPQAAGLLIWLGQLALIPAASFGGGAAAPWQDLAAAICWGAHGLLGIASVALAVAGVAAAHHISLWRAAAAWLLAALIVIGALAAAFASAALLIALRGG